MKKRHALGQHFLISSSVAKLIVDSAEITNDDVVLEVGTGKGAITHLLCERAGKVISVEKDSKLYVEAKKRFSQIPNLRLEHGDAFKKNYQFDVFVSNLPYSQSRNAIEWLVKRRFSHAIIMVQREFADKLLTKTGREKRAISILANYGMKIQRLFDVHKTEFFPISGVDSVVLRLDHRMRIKQETIDAINSLFSFRRKTIRNIAKQFGISLDSSDRLEELSDGDILKIAKKIIQ